MYTELYSLDEKPFDITPDPNFLYLTENHREALSSMIYGINEKKGIISITGEVGTGKTTLIYSLLKNLTENINTVFIYHTNITFEQLLKKILLELNIPFSDTDKVSLLQNLNDYLIEKFTKGEITAIIIDEAQNLQDSVLEELRMLSNLETNSSKLLQLLLIGQPELETKLNSENLRQLKQRITIRHQLRPLTLQESKHYIAHRLTIAGGDIKIFSTKAIMRICSHSKGIPRIINVVCDNALLIGYSQSAKIIKEDIINEVINDMECFIPSTPGNEFNEATTDTSALSFKQVPFYYKAAFPSALFLIIILTVLGTLFLTKSYIQVPSKADEMSLSILPNTHRENTLVPKQITKETVFTTDNFQNVLISDQDKKKYPDISSTELPEIKKDNINKSGGLPFRKNRLIENETPKNNSEGLTQEIHDNSTYSTISETAKRGTTLFHLARKYYNSDNITHAYMLKKANPEIKDINHIEVNQTINIPKINFETPIIKLKNNTYKIELGTFQSLKYIQKYFNEPLLYDKKIHIIPRKVSSTEIWYQVILEKFDNFSDCLAAVALLKEKGLLPIFDNIDLPV